MITAFDVSHTEQITLSKDSDPKTTFEIGVFDVFVKNHLRARHQLDEAEVFVFELVRFGLRGWTGLSDKDGRAVNLVTTVRSIGGHDYSIVADESLRLLDLSVLAELGNLILKLNFPSMIEQGNSEAPSS